MQYTSHFNHPYHPISPCSRICVCPALLDACHSTELSSFMASSTTKRLGDRFFTGFGASTGTGAGSASAIVQASDSDAKLVSLQCAASEAHTSATWRSICNRWESLGVGKHSQKHVLILHLLQVRWHERI